MKLNQSREAGKFEILYTIYERTLIKYWIFRLSNRDYPILKFPAQD